MTLLATGPHEDPRLVRPWERVPRTVAEGRVKAPSLRGVSLLERFEAKIQKTDGCWLWTAARSRKGYGNFQIAGRTARAAHRVAYELYVGPIPEGLDVEHRCGHRSCVNPAHLEALTHAENVRRGNTGINLASRTHCEYGHPFDEGNTGTRNDCNGRVCLTCRREATTRYRQRHLARKRWEDRTAKRRKRELGHCRKPTSAEVVALLLTRGWDEVAA